MQGGDTSTSLEAAVTNKRAYSFYFVGVLSEILLQISFMLSS